MKPSSAKAKGRAWQQAVRDRILDAFPYLTKRDVVSTSMGVSGSDIKLSEAGFKSFPYAVECKSLASNSAVTIFEQAKAHAKAEGGTPVVFIKTNRLPPVVVISVESFFDLLRARKEQ